MAPDIRISVENAAMQSLAPVMVKANKAQPLISALPDIVTDAMVLGYLRGRISLSEPKAMSTLGDAVDFMQKRLHLTPAKLANMRMVFGSVALEVTKNLGSFVEEKAQVAIQQALEQGLHVQASVKLLREAFEAAGVIPSNPFTLEAIVRTQVNIAYSAGRWHNAHDADVADLIHGFRLVTVGDDRVRPTHEAMDGMQAPMTHPVWETHWPPNGYACRCTTLDLLKPFKTYIPRRLPGADKGFGFNPGVLYGDML